jgi:hypothetical protein
MVGPEFNDSGPLPFWGELHHGAHGVVTRITA